MSSKTDEVGDGLIRVGDEERDEAVGLLGQHAQAGRLAAVDLEARTGWARAAATRAELEALFTDLPLPRPSFDPVVKSRGTDENGMIITPFSSAFVTLSVLTFLLGLPGSIVLFEYTETWWPIVAVVIVTIVSGAASHAFKKLP
ncbi:DUF1707 SHOCT-like domain-containing protein [Actinokineospora sp. HUAS TT18]|uniref:DUF1707 SHOCT-like domain-containing protein n=1 Tax=Actinokineospora sp. HUAS TT18 TaxID=3447451 RepID=UPI003F5221C9